MESEASRDCKAHRRNPQTYGRIADDVSTSFNAFTISTVDTPAAQDFLDFWSDRKRMQNEVRKVAKQIFDWGNQRGRATNKPFDKTLKAKLVKRNVYTPDQALRAVLEAMEREGGHRATHNGVMTRAFVELAYITGQRAKDVRMLRWSDLGETSMYFEPTKTSESSGMSVKFVRTPEIERILDDVRRFVAERNASLARPTAAEQEERRAKGLKTKGVAAPVDSPYVLHRLDGKPFQQTGVRTAWRRAIALTDYADSGYTIKDIRPKALTDADGVSDNLKDVQKMAVHASITRRPRGTSAIEGSLTTVTSPLVVPAKGSSST